MENEKIEKKGQTPDLTLQLANLVAAGWSEPEIMDLARERAKYARVRLHFPGDLPPGLSPAALDRLLFMRWLYQAGTVKS